MSHMNGASTALDTTPLSNITDGKVVLRVGHCALELKAIVMLVYTEYLKSNNGAKERHTLGEF
jgi:hypothetical protein